MEAFFFTAAPSPAWKDVFSIHPFQCKDELLRTVAIPVARICKLLPESHRILSFES